MQGGGVVLAFGTPPPKDTLAMLSGVTASRPGRKNRAQSGGHCACRLAVPRHSSCLPSSRLVSLGRFHCQSRVWSSNAHNHLVPRVTNAQRPKRFSIRWRRRLRRLSRSRSVVPRCGLRIKHLIWGVAGRLPRAGAGAGGGEGAVCGRVHCVGAETRGAGDVEAVGGVGRGDGGGGGMRVYPRW